MLFERLTVRWEIAGLPLDDQKMLLGRYRMADEPTQRWVRETIDAHLERHIPELLEVRKTRLCRDEHVKLVIRARGSAATSM